MQKTMSSENIPGVVPQHCGQVIILSTSWPKKWLQHTLQEVCPQNKPFLILQNVSLAIWYRRI
jgi:hypothetical protein